MTGKSLSAGRHWIERQGLTTATAPNILNRHRTNHTFLLRHGDLSFILVPGVLAVLLSGSLSKRLKELAQASSLLDGHTEVEIDTTGSDELAELSRSLVDLNRRVSRSTEELEERVRQRTEVIEQQKRELVRLNGELEEMASHDPLTALFNRRAFEEQARHLFALALRENRCLGIAMIDVDHFKSVNDRHGHLAGDDILRVLAARLTDSFRRETDLIGRYGGEEFAIVTTTDHGDGEFAAWSSPSPRPTMPWKGY